MIGHIESYDEQQQVGVLRHENKIFEFHIDDWTSEMTPKVGDDVDFMLEEDNSISEISLVGSYLINMKPVKNHYIAATLGLLFGAIGLHRLYLGFYGIAIAQIIVTYITGGFGVMWGFIESILIFGGQIHKDAKGRPLK